MADLKISQLTGASTPLAGTEVLPIVQSGSTVKVSVANLTAGRAVGMAGGSFTDNITQSTAAKGVNFTANTPAAGMTSQLLNWYEEGTWTPVLGRATGGAITASITTYIAKYMRVGSQVTVSLNLDINSVTSQGSGANYVSGLPFAPADNLGAVGALFYNTAFTTDVVTACGTWSDGKIYFHNPVNSITATAVDWKSGSLQLSITYFV